MAQSSLILWLYQFLKPHKLRIAIAMVALLISAGSWLVLGQGIKLVIDRGFVANDEAFLNQMLLAVVAIAVVGCIATYFRFYNMLWLGERVSANIRNALYAQMLRLDMGFYSRNRTGEVISRFTSDTTVLQSVIGMGLSMAIRSSVTFIGAFILMLFTSVKLTGLVMLAIPFILLPIKLLGKKVRYYAQVSQDKVADMSAHIDQSLHGIHTIQAYTQEAHDVSSLHRKVEQVMGAAEQRIHYRALLIICIMAISIFAVVFVAWIGATAVISGELSPGSLSAFIFYAVMAGGAVATISEVIGEIQKAKGASARIRELLQEPVQLRETKQSEWVLRQSSKEILRLDNLAFRYQDNVEYALQHLNLSITSGQTVAIVGPSGAGKSTLMDVLLDFYPPTSGAVTLGNTKYSELSQAQIRNCFALVAQDPVIFATDIAQNIGYGDHHASFADIEQAAKLANAHDFIMSLPEQYATQVGERGIKLSGGQKQRIAIARAFLANRPILLLDEATSALDAGSEQAVQQGLANLMQDRTTIVIAHRLATVKHADVIVVMEHGQIVDSGTHEELMLRCDLYRDLAELQFVS
jgi:ATP-binding cassette subfamily B protein